jgi:ABC-type lipoprotein release transport system permease subunit
MFVRLAGCFGVLAVVLIATGLYGTLSYCVSKRNAEIGLRMALGAQRWQIVWMVLRGSLLLTTMSVVIGIPLAIAASRGLVFLRQFLTGKTASVSYTYGDGRDSQEIAKTFSWSRHAHDYTAVVRFAEPALEEVLARPASAMLPGSECMVRDSVEVKSYFYWREIK